MRLHLVGPHQRPIQKAITMTSIHHSNRLASFTAAIVAVLSLAACGEDVAVATSVSSDRTTRALLSGDLESVNGSYGAGCRNRTGAWSVEILGGATLDNAPLSVVLNDTACVLTLTSLHTTAGILDGTPTFALTTAFQATASAFGTPTDFFANARLSSVAFSTDFVISIVFSEDPALATADNTAQFDVVVATATAAGAAPVPDFLLDVSGILVRTDVNDVVQSATGSAALSNDVVAGKTFVVVTGGGLTTHAQLDAAFVGESALTATIPAAAFTLGGTDLTANQVRTLIIADTAEGVASYQAFTITFHPAL